MPSAHYIVCLHRPSYAQLDALREENENLRKVMEKLAKSANCSVDDFIKHAGRDSDTLTVYKAPIVRNEAPEVAEEAPMSANSNQSYHGPTSTLFDYNVDKSINPRPKVPPEYVEKVLIAEAAHQRHMESINFQAGKLDFDGVDPDLGMHLLKLHWNRQHHSFLISYRPAFMRDMACGGPYFSKLLLNAIYFGAAKFSSRLEVRTDPADVRTAGLVFRKRVKELLGGALDKSEITTIQALLIMSTSLFALGDEQSAAWLYAGIAFRMITDLGMHLDAPILPNLQRLSDEDLEIRRRVFWGAFVLDKIQSLYQGRPVSLHEGEIRVPIIFHDTYEELEHWEPFSYTRTHLHPGCPSYSTSTFTELCKLSIIMNKILDKIYTQRTASWNNEQLSELLDALHAELDRWHSQLPTHLNYVPFQESSKVPAPHVFSLLAMYNVLTILLHRPFVSDGHLQAGRREVALGSFVTCAEAGMRIVNLVKAYGYYFSIRQAPYLISYSMYVGATILVRLAAQREPGSEAHEALLVCMSTFNKNQETNYAVKRMNLAIENLARRVNVKLNPDNAGSSEEPSDHPLPEKQASRDEAGPAESNSLVDDIDFSTIAPQIDIDAIFQSFLRGQPTVGRVPFLDAGNVNPVPHASSIEPLTSTSMNSLGDLYNDLLFGFNGSVVDDFNWGG